MLITYDKIIEIASEIANNDLILKDGLTIQYELGPYNHLKLDEDLYFRANPNASKADFKHTEVFEIPFDNFILKFITKDLVD